MQPKSETKSNTNALIHNLAYKLDLKTVHDCDEIILKIPHNKGDGVIIGLNLPFGVSAIILQCSINENIQLVQDDCHKQPLRFVFIRKGCFKHGLNELSNQIELNKDQCAISAEDKNGNETISLTANKNIEVLIIEIDRSKFLEKIECDLYSLNEKLISLFKDIENKHKFYWSSYYSISIEECLVSIMNNQKESIVRRYFVEAKIYEIFSHLFKQFADDVKPEGKTSILRKNDIETIKKAKEYLIKDLSKAPTIIELSKYAGINQQKLKKGFKEIYNTTPYKYLRNTRLNESKLLLVEGSLSVSEVAERIGYSNKSHFARRFKEKFGILPYKFIKSFRSNL